MINLHVCSMPCEILSKSVHCDFKKPFKSNKHKLVFVLSKLVLLPEHTLFMKQVWITKRKWRQYPYYWGFAKAQVNLLFKFSKNMYDFASTFFLLLGCPYTNGSFQKCPDDSSSNDWNTKLLKIINLWLRK